MSGYLVESTFLLNDGATLPLKAMIANMKQANIQLGAMRKMFADTNLQLGIFRREVTGAAVPTANLARESTIAARGIDRMATASRAAYGRMVQQNIQMHEMVLTMREMQTAAQGAALANRNMGLGAMGAGAARGRGGGGGGGAAAGGIGALVGGLGRGIGGAASAGLVAMIGLDVFKNVMHPAMEYEQQKAGLSGYGLNAVQIAQADKKAREMQRQMPATSAVENLKAIKESYGITKDFDQALRAAPKVAKVLIAMQSLENRIPGMKGKGNDFVQSMMKSSEMVGSFSPEAQSGFYDNVLKEMEVSGGLVNPNAIGQMLKNARGARRGKSDEFLYAIMGHVLEESPGGGGGGKSGGWGQALAFFQNQMIGGHTPKLLLQQLAQSGALEPGTKTLGTTTTGTSITGGGIKNRKLFVENPAKWLWQEFMPGMLKKEFPKLSQSEAEKRFYGMGDSKEGRTTQQDILIRNLSGLSRTAFDLATQFITMKPQLEKHIMLWERAHTVEQQYAEAIQMTAIRAESAKNSIEILALGIGQGLQPAVNLLLDGITNLALNLSDSAKIFTETEKAISGANEQLFGTQGAFQQLGASMSAIDWKPILKLMDILLAASVSQTGKTLGGAAGAIGTIAAGIAKGQSRADKLQARTGIPSWLTAGPMETAATAEVMTKGLYKAGVNALTGAANSAADNFIGPQQESPVGMIRSQFFNPQKQESSVDRLMAAGQMPDITVNQTFNGPAHPEHVRKASMAGLLDGHAKMLAMAAKVHAATTAQAGGNLADNQFAGGR